MRNWNTGNFFREFVVTVFSVPRYFWTHSATRKIAIFVLIFLIFCLGKLHFLLQMLIVFFHTFCRKKNAFFTDRTNFLFRKPCFSVANRQSRQSLQWKFQTISRFDSSTFMISIRWGISTLFPFFTIFLLTLGFLRSPFWIFCHEILSNAICLQSY